MITFKTKAQADIASTATRSADELSLKLFNLTEIVKLAAFAAESRRALEGIKNSAVYRPEMRNLIDESSECANTWEEMDDATGNVLDYLARELGAINSKFVETVYDLANGTASSTDQKGGAA